MDTGSRWQDLQAGTTAPLGSTIHTGTGLLTLRRHFSGRGLVWVTVWPLIGLAWLVSLDWAPERTDAAMWLASEGYVHEYVIAEELDDTPVDIDVYRRH
jgi:hypothetical protein